MISTEGSLRAIIDSSEHKNRTGHLKMKRNKLLAKRQMFTFWLKSISALKAKTKGKMQVIY